MQTASHTYSSQGVTDSTDWMGLILPICVFGHGTQHVSMNGKQVNNDDPFAPALHGFLSFIYLCMILLNV